MLTCSGGLVILLGLPEVEPGRWEAADLIGLHIALAPWQRRRCAR